MGVVGDDFGDGLGDQRRPDVVGVFGQHDPIEPRGGGNVPAAVARQSGERGGGGRGQGTGRKGGSRARPRRGAGGKGGKAGRHGRDANGSGRRGQRAAGSLQVGQITRGAGNGGRPRRAGRGPAASGGGKAGRTADRAVTACINISSSGKRIPIEVLQVAVRPL